MSQFFGRSRLEEIGIARRTLPPVLARECAVTYLCFIESSILTAPHMEPLAATTPDDALQESVELMRQHSSAIAVHVFLGDDHIGSALATDPSAARDLSDGRQNAAI